MPHIRIMPDGTKKEYYTEDEFYNLFEQKIHEASLDLDFSLSGNIISHKKEVCIG